MIVISRAGPGEVVAGTEDGPTLPEAQHTMASTQPQLLITDPDPPEERGGTRVSRRRLFLLASGVVLGTAGSFKLLSGFAGFRINEVEASTPAFDPETFRLTVDGAVENPISLSFDELTALPAVDQVSDFHCVEGWGVNDVRWRGVRLQTIIDTVRPRDVSFITFHSMGGVYRDSLTMDQASFPDVLLAYQMYERPLPPRHGLPLRLIVPHMYGYKGPKWLTRIEFAGNQEIGYWEQRGWHIDAWLA